MLAHDKIMSFIITLSFFFLDWPSARRPEAASSEKTFRNYYIYGRLLEAERTIRKFKLIFRIKAFMEMYRVDMLHIVCYNQ